MSVFRGENCALFAPSQVERKAMCFRLKLESIVDVKKQTSVGGHDGGGGGSGSVCVSMRVHICARVCVCKSVRVRACMLPYDCIASCHCAYLPFPSTFLYLSVSVSVSHC